MYVLVLNWLPPFCDDKYLMPISCTKEGIWKVKIAHTYEINRFEIGNIWALQNWANHLENNLYINCYILYYTNKDLFFPFPAHCLFLIIGFFHLYKLLCCFCPTLWSIRFRKYHQFPKVSIFIYINTFLRIIMNIMKISTSNFDFIVSKIIFIIILKWTKILQDLLPHQKIVLSHKLNQNYYTELIPVCQQLTL